MISEPLKKGGIQRCHHSIALTAPFLMRVLGANQSTYEDLSTEVIFVNMLDVVGKKELATWLIQQAVKDAQV
jgi:hypothetical protein